MQPPILRVLLVDDIAMNRDIAQSFLQAAGHAVTSVDNGPDAIAVAETGNFDVVLMDVRMPGMDGLEATRRIRALDGPASHVPILGLTAQAFAEQVEECRRAGMDGHLAKPYGPAALQAAVTAAAGRGHEPVPASPQPKAVAHPAGPAADLIGADMPLLDPAIAARLATFLPADVVASYLQAIRARADATLQDIDRRDPPCPSTTLADSVHALTGSAGMFGFMRLAGVGRQLEQALRSGTIATSDLTQGYRAAIVASLSEIPPEATQTERP